MDFNYLKKLPKLLIIFAALFLLSFIAYFYIQQQYIHESESNFVESIRQEVKLLIEIKKQNTFEIAQRLAIDNKLIHILEEKEYKKLYDEEVFNAAKKFKEYKHLGLHIVDAKGINRYLSWTKQGLGEYVLNKREDLKELYKHPHPVSSVSVGMFDITFKGIMPIYSNGKFLGIVEVINHFNSIARALEKNDIYSALIIEKRFTKQLKYPLSKVFIDGYNISTLGLNGEVEKFLREKGVEFFLKIRNYTELHQENIFNNYFVTKVDISGINHDVIAHYIIFIKDRKHLELKEILLQLLTGLMGLLFLFMTYFGFKVDIENKNLIESLNKRVKKETEKNLALIYTDNLTNCYSKEKFLADSKIYKDKELVMLNIKNFSQINATYGFKTGDEILRLCCIRLESILKKKIYRIDSDEFVFISDTVRRDILHINRHFNDDSLYVTKGDINIRVSFSFAVVHGNEEDPLRKLSIAMRQAKREPYKLYVHYKEEDVNNEFIKFNSYLYDAIFSQQEARIIPYFQGIHDNRTGEIRKYEALARLEVNGKIYTPYYFIDIAKNSGFFTEITKIMINKSLACLAKQPRELSLSINITEDDLHSKHLKEYLLKRLAYYDLKPHQIILEILEGVSAEGTQSNIIQLKELKEAGFRLSIDDFGVENSNFERLSELDVDFIKIDGKYIKNIDNCEKSYKIVKAISEFASSMDIEVIAEYVENEKIQKVLTEIGIEYSQGYLFSKPSRHLGTS